MIIDCQSYKIFVGDVHKNLDTFDFNRYSSVFVLLDENTKSNCYPIIKNQLPQHKLISISSGESNKNISTCSFIWNELIEQKADRRSLLINLGGGVIGDMGGFSAATYMRGIDFINIPTTLLAMVDASIGGKIGVDFNQYKNMVGLFQSPKAIFVDPIFLKTLEKRQLISGFAEVLKHALIANENYWKSLSKLIEDEIDIECIIKSIGIKKNIVEQDPYESGNRKILNFGHTIGHAIESYHLNSDKLLLHGEAVAIGMICESYISNGIGILGNPELKSITSRIIKIYGHHPECIPTFDNLITIINKDKKNIGKEILGVGLDKIGKAKFNIPFSHDLIKDSLTYYCQKVKI